MDIEVDECTAAKYPSRGRTNPVSWISHIGLVTRGEPRSLNLVRLPVGNTKARAPRPGPITLDLWRDLAREHLQSHELVLHLDSAPAYRMPIKGNLHTSVIHQVKKIDGKWVRPVFARNAKLALPGGGELKVCSGTQTIDGFWTLLKRHVHKTQSKNPMTVDEFV